MGHRALDDGSGDNAALWVLLEALPRGFGGGVGSQDGLEVDSLRDPFAIAEDVGLEGHGRLSPAGIPK
jgi:hypothetical protein